MQQILHSQHHFYKLLRFGFVGAINTGVDIGIYTLLHSVFHWDIALANTISTSIALGGSYVMHSRFTFQKKTDWKGRALYVVVTLFGLWVLQLVVIIGVTTLLEAHLHITPAGVDILAKVLGVVVSMLWNYSWYNKVVFAHKAERK